MLHTSNSITMKQKTLYLSTSFFTLLLTLLLALPLSAQRDCFFTHYSSEDGLSQNTVMSIVQDQKGNMWFTTWNGLNKFNGYTFKKYQARPGSHVALTNDRIDYLCEDPRGYLWMLTYDSHAFRFDPRSEQFERVPAQGEPGSDVAVNAIRLLDNGSVWLLLERKGAIRVTTDSQTRRLTTHWYNDRQEHQFGQLFDVFSDKSGDEWMLTDNGLARLNASDGKVTTYFVGKTDTDGEQSAFYVCHEQAGKLYFGSHHGRLWVYHCRQGRFELVQLDCNSSVTDIRQLDARRIVVATAADGLFVLPIQGGAPHHYTHPAFSTLGPIHSLYVDSHGEVWVEQHAPGEIVHFDPSTGQFRHEKIAVEQTSTDRSRPAFHIHEDINGVLWVHPYGGGFSFYDRATRTLHPFYNSFTGNDWRFSNKIHSAFSDRQGNLWMSTHSKGLEKVTFRPKQFALFTPEPHHYESLSNEVRALCEDSNHLLWVGLKNGKLQVYNPDHSLRGYLTESGTIAHSGRPMDGNVYHIMEDSRRNLWISTKGKGLVKAEPQPGGHYRLTRYRHSERDLYSLSHDNVYCAYEDVRGRIWVATFAEGVNYLTQNAEGQDIFINHRNHLKGYPINDCGKVRYITGDSQGCIWIATTVGALVVNARFSEPEQAVFHHFVLDVNDRNSLSNNDVHWIVNTRKGELYFATFGGGLNKLVSLEADGRATFRSFTTDDGLPSDIILSVREDHKGSLWMSTENGLCKFNPIDRSLETYSHADISYDIRFSEAASLITTRNHILFGCNMGIFGFQPDSVSKSCYVPPIVLSQLLIDNTLVMPGEHSVLHNGLDETDKLVLSHEQNSFTIQYAALDYTAPNAIQYAYMLEGFDKQWNYVGNQRIATYTNLPKGNYVFKVRSTNADRVLADNVRELPIRILPSFWETPVAYFFYFALFIGVILVTVYLLFTFYRLKHEVRIEQKVTDIKLRFFTDISHELRTPLTLIAGPVEALMARPQLPADVREQLTVVERNTNRMLRLINQILDFRKIQNRKMKMLVQRTDIVAFTRKVMENYDSVADEHHINYLLESEQDHLFLWVDADKFEKILFNLLSNAFKYTPAGRMIKVFIRDNGQTVSVGVHDQGIGIADNRRKSLFVRFENLVDHNLFDKSSTGIGLSLVRELVEMHHATITVDSKVGEGSCFTVSFLKGKDHYEETVEFVAADVDVDAAGTTQPQSAGDTEVDSHELPVMLIVEDNSELCAFLRSIFASTYRVVEAADGIEGLKQAETFVPDMIISDLMMPHMDGIEMLRQLRQTLNISHIPVILLTAKTSIESMLEGMEYGADDYITKPFSATYLKARVRNLLLQRTRLQERFRQTLLTKTPVVTSAAPASLADAALTDAVLEDTSLADATLGDATLTDMSLGVASADRPQIEKPAELSAADRKFMDKLMELMEKNMDNGNLIVDDFVKELGVSRSILFKKMKSLTGLSPIEFIKQMRINRAAELILTGEYNMSDVSYMVGINDPRYFSKCFKIQMGMTPTEYKERNRKK